jgi:hypothetical protein
MSAEPSFRVVVSREGEHWLGQLDGAGAGQTFAPTLQKLDRYLREVIVLAADLPESVARQLILEYEFHTGDERFDTLVTEARTARRAAQHEERRARELAEKVIGSDRARGMSRRDLAVLLDTSHQRLHEMPTR